MQVFVSFLGLTLLAKSPALLSSRGPCWWSQRIRSDLWLAARWAKPDEKESQQHVSRLELEGQSECSTPPFACGDQRKTMQELIYKEQQPPVNGRRKQMTMLSDGLCACCRLCSVRKELNDASAARSDILWKQIENRKTTSSIRSFPNLRSTGLLPAVTPSSGRVLFEWSSRRLFAEIANRCIHACFAWRGKGREIECETVTFS